MVTLHQNTEAITDVCLYVSLNYVINSATIYIVIEYYILSYLNINFDLAYSNQN